MRGAVGTPVDPGYVAQGLMRMLPPEAQDSEQCQIAMAQVVAMFWRIAGFGVKE